jgi:hypothetical protein
MKNRRGFQVALALVGAVLVGAACDSSTEPEIVIPTIPTLPPAPPATILVYNDFNGENGGQGVNNFTQLANWNVIGGCVDLHGNGFVDVQAGHGIYIDLDGTCLTGGTIESKTAFDLAPGNYTLEFWLAGNQRIDAPDTVDVSLGTLFEEMIVLPRTQQFRLYTRSIVVGAQTSATLRFHNRGGDDQGSLLDEVRLRQAQ